MTKADVVIAACTISQGALAGIDRAIVAVMSRNDC